MGRAVEAPSKRDFRNRVTAPAWIGHVSRAFLETATQDVGGYRLVGAGEYHPQIARGELQTRGDQAGAEIRVTQVLLDEELYGG